MAFYALERLSDLYDGYCRPFRVAGQSLLLIQQDGKTYLIENRCPHMDAPLNDGKLLDPAGIRCRAHGIEFDLVTGRAQGPLADTIDCLRKFPLAYDGNQVGVEL